MLVKYGPGVLDARGSMAGTTAARNAAGAYWRARVKPVNPRSILQGTRRGLISYLTNAWSDELTAQQRNDWRAYAAGSNWTNKLGENININAVAAFTHLNCINMLEGDAIRLDAPTAMGHAGGVYFTFEAHTDTDNIAIDEPTWSFDKDTDGHRIFFFCGLPAPAGRIGIPKGFRFIGRLAGSSTSPPSFPWIVPAPYTMQDDQWITVRAMFIDETYRMSGPHWWAVSAAPSS